MSAPAAIFLAVLAATVGVAAVAVALLARRGGQQ